MFTKWKAGRIVTLRICVDFNGIVGSPTKPGGKAVVLDTMGALKGLCNAGVRLVEDLPLIGFDASDAEEDLEVHGVARYDRASSWWVIDFDEVGVRYVPAGDRKPVETFNCMACGESLSEQIRANGLQLGDVCVRCGVPVHTPILPPEG